LLRESNLKSYQSLVKQDLLNLLGISAGNGWDTTHRIGQYCRLSFILIGSFYPSPTLPCFIFLCANSGESTLLACFIPDRRRAFNLCSRDPFVCTVLALERFLFRRLLRGASVNISKLLTRCQNCSLLSRS